MLGPGYVERQYTLAVDGYSGCVCGNSTVAIAIKLIFM